MPINYPQKWLREHKVEISTVGWFRPVTYEILKCQKYIRGGDPVNVDKVYIIAPDNVNVNENVRISVKLLPRVATETDYDLTISDETICTLDKITNTLVFKDKPGKVTITVIMKEGGATNTKDINVRLACKSVEIKEGNSFVSGVEKVATFVIKPDDATDEIISVDVDVRDRNYVNLENVSDNVYKINSDYVGSYFINVNVSGVNFKVPIYIIENDADQVKTVALEFKDKYKFNEVIEIEPTFTPDNTKFNSYNITLENYDIAQYISSKNQIITNQTNGLTKGVIQMIVGGAKQEFTINVEDSSGSEVEDSSGSEPELKLVTKLEIKGIPENPKVGEAYPYTVKVTPADATDKTWTPTATNGAIIDERNVQFTSVYGTNIRVTANDGSGVFATKDVSSLLGLS